MKITTASLFVMFIIRSTTAAFATATRNTRPSFSIGTRSRTTNIIPKASNKKIHQLRSFSTILLAAGGAVVTSTNGGNSSAMAATLCEPDEDGHDYEEGAETISMPFAEEVIHTDTYNGVTLFAEEIDSSHTSDPSIFAEALQNALTIWKAEGRKGIWIHIPTSLSHLIPVCVQNGFDFHVVKRDHPSLGMIVTDDKDDKSQNREGTLVLSQWLPDTPSRLPYGPTHQVGIGALVLHPSDSTKMLLVQEKTGPAAARKLWKMPTGIADPGEDVADAAVRELEEETGLKSTFDSIVCFRQAHPTVDHRKSSNAAAASDLFFVCLLRLSKDYSIDHHEAQEEEIADIDWKSIEEYASQDLWQGSPLYGEINRIMMKAAQQVDHHQPLPDAFVETKLPVGFRPGTNSLYMASKI
mmetsp:Transcript_692/g.1000  ORF Transcript_692/g.1000 Transcript_692/m.1000 type:complete len:411 (+) Transcript_692:64-1296(+)